MIGGPRKIRLVIVDDIAETIDNLAKLIAFEPDMDVVGLALGGREALRIASSLQPDVVLMDIFMPDMDGITATEILVNTPGWAGTVVMISVAGDQDHLRRAMLAGAAEYLVKPFSADELVDAIRRVYARQQHRDSQIGGRPSTVDTTQPSVRPPHVPTSAVPDAEAPLPLVVAHPDDSSYARLPHPPAGDKPALAPSDAPAEAFKTLRWSIVMSLSWLVGLTFFVLVLIGVIQAYGSGPGILRGFVGGVISFFAELTGGALLMWLNFVGVGSVIGLAFSLIGAARGRQRWFVPPLFVLVAVAVTPTRQGVEGVLNWLGGVSRWNDAAYWGAALGVLFLMAVTAPAFVRDLWRWCNGATLAELTRRGMPLSFAWLAVPLQAIEQGSGLLGWLPILVIIAIVTALCGRG